MQSWEEEKKHMSADFHLNEPVDPVETLVEKVGDLNVAFDELMARIDDDPNDTEARRQAALLVNKLDEFSARLKGKIQH